MMTPIQAIPGKAKPKLFVEDVETICKRYRLGESSLRIGARLGVHHSTVSTVLHRKWFARVPSGHDAAGAAVYERPAICPVVKLTDADAAEIRRLYKAGWLQREIAVMFDVTQPCVSMVLDRVRRA